MQWFPAKEVVLGFGLAAELGNPSGSSFIEDGIQSSLCGLPPLSTWACSEEHGRDIQSRHCSGEILSAPR